MNSPVIRFENVEFGYDKQTSPILRGINLDIREGDFIALIGQNGAGKTTLAKHINGILKPTRGDVWVRGRNTREYKRDALARLVGYCYQNPDHQIFSQSVEKEVGFGPRAAGLAPEAVKRRIEEALQLVGLEGKRELHPSMLGRGERQRLAVASILAVGASILVVDEPTTGLDYAGITRIMNLLKEWNEKLNVTIVIITHDIPVVADYVPRTIAMAGGRILKDAPTADVLSDLQTLRYAQVKPLQVTRVGRQLGLMDPGDPIITVPGLVRALSRAKSDRTVPAK
ncbi:energy-coupling factor ABC transporter ATP-binding protein [Paenibacillus humicola]|uniref:energy-coupling factor ABC transporter ATP-binding protein n=1 Tax=Paenibacillus humicola TaxID=3110540 RepID=UPI00237B7FFB|nr:ABC transporter ATP-binding protein [Paenibacillus humicola]